ncbi:tripartite tricarboxylate transporter substrate binding protein [Treponema sp. OMZ 840]|uniref:Bug family tripartite tricarboxylate transporter substrate binding protein n=1 Tax=Treponema sp. OMZ 840 TaxID=244313 RepID=UPI003D923F2E
MKKRFGLVIVFLLLCSLTAFAAGQSDTDAKDSTNWPNKSIKVIVPYGAGGGADITVRLITKWLEKEIGQPVIVANITGGSGTIGFSAITEAKPDGYTFGYGDCNMSNGKLLFEGIKYDNTSFSPIAQFANDPHILIVSKKSGIKTLSDLINKVKANPDSVTFGLGGAWSSHDFLRIKLENQLGIKFRRMPFQGGAAAVTAVAGGNCDVAVPFVSEALAQIQAGNVIPIAISSDKRNNMVPNIPTMKEQGLDFSHAMWRALVGPADIPENILIKLDAMLSKVFANPEYQKEVALAGSTMEYMPYSQFKEYFHKSHDNYNKLITDALKSTDNK